MPLVLASSSPRRSELLGGMGVEPDVIFPADIEEICRQGEEAGHFAERMAREKAEAVYAHYPAHAVLAGDTVASAGCHIFGKPGNRDDAKRMLELLSGRKHRIYGGIALITPEGHFLSRKVVTQVKVKRLNPQEIEAYLATGDYEGKAGGYGIQGPFSAFVAGLNGSYTNVVGLCLHNVCKLMIGSGIATYKS